MKPWTTATKNPKHATLLAFPTAAETLAYFDQLIDDAGVEPSKAVQQCRDDLSTLAIEEEQELSDVEMLRDRDGLDLTESVSLLTRATAGTGVSIDDAARIEAGARILATDSRERARHYKHLANQVRFYRARDAARRIRQLGDGVLDGLLNPWIDRIMTELRPLAIKLAEGDGREQIIHARIYHHEQLEDADISEDIKQFARFPDSARKHFATFRAIELSAELEHVATAAHDLRTRGFIPRAADEHFPEVFYSFKNAEHLPPMKYMAHTEDTATLWIARAIAAGCEPCARSAKQAEAARPALAEATP
ncbi:MULTISPECIES: hypothetical protein [Actinomycetes]|uniref:hypothetical protein n=1 Tax=Actinomycetes TaxID=1760 RepID=UPI0004BF272D|nr:MULTISPECIES: hypothetical protein [Actinomycetes]